MKKMQILLLALLMLLSLCACNREPEDAASVIDPTPVVTEATEASTEAPTETPTEPSVPEEGFSFPAGSALFGVDISDMTPQDACTAINEALAEYKLMLSVNNYSLLLNQENTGLRCDEQEILTYASQLEQKATQPVMPKLTYDVNLLRQKLANALNVSPKDAYVSYSASSDAFVIHKGSVGKNVELSGILSAVDPVILSLGQELSVSAPTADVQPKVASDDPALKDAQAKANAYLDIKLTYTYTPASGESLGSQAITKDEIGSFVYFEDNEPKISASAVTDYADKMGKKYSVGGGKGKFKTSGGSYINITVSYAGQPVDTNALAKDIKTCLTNGTSGTRPAPYIDPSLCQELAYDGNYVEVNLSAQHLWVYRGGKCVVSTPIVSGCVFEKNYTPTGVYSIYSKVRSTYLVGADYRSYVDYWMPFHGGYGLHDANWRSSFGGDIYLYDGSHGCVNIPPAQAGKVYSNISVGTKVILYGGATNADPVAQEMSGKTSYEVGNNAKPFKLDAKAVYGDKVKLSYTSSDPTVVEVAKDGTVTIKGVGTATITVKAEKKDYYTDAELKVTITVYDNCQKNGHTFGDWKETKAPTCTEEGSKEHECAVCKEKESEKVKALGHKWGSWKETLAPTCTAEGSREHTCSVCKEKETTTVDAKGHSYGDWTEILAPTCTTDGSREQTCAVCGNKNTEAIPGGHKYENWTITKAPTCTSGEETGTCSVCGNVTTRSVDPITTEHTYGDPVHTDATCGKAGYNTYTCQHCGNIKTEETDPATGNHAFTPESQYCGNGCGAENPGYIPPAPPVTDPPSGEQDTTE